MRTLYESILDDEEDLVVNDDELIMSKLRKLCDYKAPYQYQQHEKDIRFIKPLCKKFWKTRKKLSQCKSKYSVRFNWVDFFQATELNIITKNKSAGGVNVYTFYCGNNHIIVNVSRWSDSVIKIIDENESPYYEIPDRYNKEFEKIIDNIKIK